MSNSPKHPYKRTLSKELYWIRGVAIILVVMSHVIGFTPDLGMRELYQSDLPILGWIADRANSIHMPMFFAISGLAFFVFSNRKISYRDFFSKKASRLLVPLIIWSPLYFFFQNFYKGNSFTWFDLLGSIISPYQIFWFLHALIWITLITFLYFRYQSSLVLYSAIAIALFIIGLNTDNQILRNGYWNFFYAVGLISGHFLPSLWQQLEERFRLQENQLSSVSLVLFSSLVLIFSLLLVAVNPQVVGFEISRLALGLPAFFLWLVGIIFFARSFSEADSTNDNGGISLRGVISYIGKQSLIIYIFHGYFTRAFAILAKTFLPTLPLPGLFFLFATFLGTIGPLLLYHLILRRSQKTLFLVGGA